MSGFSFSKLKKAKPSMRRRLFLYMGALAALLLVTLFAVLLLLGQLKSPREELAKSLTFRMEAFQSDMESLWRNVSVMGLHLSEDMTVFSMDSAQQRPGLLCQCVNAFTGSSTGGKLLLHFPQAIIKLADLSVVALKARLG